jgi:DNA-binding GntR family transcriptional regulator
LRNRLLGLFHVRIAEMVGNKVLTEMLADLVTRSSLITLLLQSSKAASCSSDEHVALVEAIRARKSSQVQKLLLDHLEHVERDLADLESRRRDFDLADALRSPGGDRRRMKAGRNGIAPGARRAKGRVPSAP